MTKTIYSITPGEGRSDYSDAILQIIANHNQGRATVNFDIIKGYCFGDYARWTAIRVQPSFKYDKENGILEVWESNKVSFTVHEKMIEVLEPTEEDKNIEQN